MKNTIYADQSDTIRTLTEEEVAVVSGGLTFQQFAALEGGYAYGNFNKYFPQPQYTYRPSNYYTFPSNLSSSKLSFLERVYLNSSEFANAGAIWGAIQN